MSLPYDPNKVYAEMLEAGEAWADKKAAARLMEESKKSILSDIMQRSDERSQAGKEAHALAHPEYRAYLVKMVAAMQESDRAWVRYQAIIALSEHRRSQEASRRAEMRLV